MHRVRLENFSVIPAEAGIQRYLNVISYVSVYTGFPLPATCYLPSQAQASREQVPACAGTGLDSRFRGNDKKE